MQAATTAKALADATAEAKPDTSGSAQPADGAPGKFDCQQFTGTNVLHTLHSKLFSPCSVHCVYVYNFMLDPECMAIPVWKAFGEWRSMVCLPAVSSCTLCAAELKQDANITENGVYANIIYKTQLL